jgi:prepilin-type N-terminal cleavage/methylation domain-containing protein
MIPRRVVARVRSRMGRARKEALEPDMKSPITYRPLTTGFSLVELLVVITIIVVLLALLTPALDQAIYQAELAACGAQLRGVTQASLVYAMEYKRQYPNRGTASYSWTAMELKSAASHNIPALMHDHVAVKNFVDPFLKAADLDLDEAMQDPASYFLPGYHYYGDWGAVGQSYLTPMKKVGSKMIFNAPAPEGDTRRFGVIFVDRDVRYTNLSSQVSHPDKDGQLRPWSWHGKGNFWASGGFVDWASGGLAGGEAGAVEGNFYVAWWEGANRGTLDNNYGLDDGSVLRLNDVPMVFTPEDDPRITFVPDEHSLDSYSAGRKVQLPREAD